MMKNVHIFSFCLAIVLFITACKKGNSPSPQKDITGKWTVAKTVDYTLQNNNRISADTVTHGTAEDYVTFNANGSGDFSLRAFSTLQKKEFVYTFVSDDKINIAYPGTGTTDEESITAYSSSSLTLHHTQTYVSSGLTVIDVTDIYLRK